MTCNMTPTLWIARRRSLKCRDSIKHVAGFQDLGPARIGPSDIMMPGRLCSSMAASVPTGGLSQARPRRHAIPARPVASKCSQSASTRDLAPDERIAHLPALPFLRIPSEVAIVYSGRARAELELIWSLADTGLEMGNGLPQPLTSRPIEHWLSPFVPTTPTDGS